MNLRAAVCDSLDASVDQRFQVPFASQGPGRGTPEAGSGMRQKINSKSKELTFDQVLSILGNERFDVSPASGGAKGVSGARRVSKYGCAAEIAPSELKAGSVRVLARPGWVLGGEISRILDRGYQKFLATGTLQVPATADHLRALHRFEEEFKEAIGQQSLYNESMGTTSDVYLYDRLVGRETV